MSRDGSGIYTYPVGTPGSPGTTILSARYNTFLDDLALTLNTALPVNMGGTGATAPAGARTNLGIDTAINTAVDAARASYDHQNLVVNGGMQVAQETPGNNIISLNQASANLGYACDLFPFTCNVVGQAYTVNQVTAGLVGMGLGSGIFINCTTGAAPGATVQSLMQHFVEGDRCARLWWGTASAVAITVSFWVNCNTTGILPISIRNSAADRCYVTGATITTANIWQFVSVMIPGDTSGTWLKDPNTIGMRIGFGLSVGSNFNVAALNAWGAGNLTSHSTALNFLAANGRQTYIVGLAVLPGSTVLTSAIFPLTLRSFTDDLPFVQRYWQKTYPYANAAGAAVTGGAVIAGNGPTLAARPFLQWRFPVRMRTTPTAFAYSPATGAVNMVRNQNSSADVAATTWSLSDTEMTVYPAGTSTAGDAFNAQFAANARF